MGFGAFDSFVRCDNDRWMADDSSRPHGVGERVLWAGATGAIAFVVLTASGFELSPSLLYGLVAASALAGGLFGPWVMELLSAL